MERPLRRASLFQLALVVLVVVTLATSTGTAVAAKSTTKVWPAMATFDPTIAWVPCHDTWECGTLNVPVDWTTGGSDQVPLAVARHAATSPDERIGVLAVNPGGPGQGGVDYLPQLINRFPDTVLARFDIVTWDPRGTGHSRPVDCVDDAFLDTDTPIVPDTAAELTVARDYSAAFARGCTQRMGAYAGQVGTRNSARDLEAIRIALGEQQLNYLGFSYGVVLGMTYAQMFPGAVRTMVLDGPPDYWQPSLEYAYAQAAGFKQAFDAFLDWCEQDQSCALRSVAPPREAFESLRASLQTTPIAAEYTLDDVTRSGTVTEATMANAVIGSMYDERWWPTLADALDLAARDGDGSGLLERADDFVGRHPDGTWDSLYEAFLTINCVDRPDRAPRSAAHELADILRFQNDLPPWGGSWATSGCVGMPKAAKGDKLGDVRVAGTPPVLVVATTGDPATPYSGAAGVVARIAGAGLLTFESTDHTAFGTGRSDCIDAAVTSYLVDATLPAPDTRCT
ncbi:MAG: alpha/beta hydrolase [Acidimicrobiia bacterium]